MFVDWRGGGGLQTDASSDLVDWRKDIEVAAPDEGYCLDRGSFNYLNVPAGELPKDMTKKEIPQNWQDVKQATVKDIQGL